MVKGAYYLSDVDKKIVKALLFPDGKRTTEQLAKKLGVAVSTFHRRRARLEKDFLKINYTIDISKFGWHEVDFLVATESGNTDAIGNALLKRDDIVYVGKSIGQHTIDLRIRTILKDNSEILRMLEFLKGTPGIKDVVWTEIVEVIGSKSSIPPHIIDNL